MRSEAVRRPGPEALDQLAELVRPTTLTREQRLPVLPALVDLLPGGGLRRGSTVSVATAGEVSGASSLALALVAEASRGGSWVAVVGLPSLGLVAADELGVAIERLVLVAAPERDAWGSVMAALVDGFDLVVLHAGRGGVRAADARRLTARARERGAVVVQLGSGWPDGADLALEVTASRWEGLGDGHGHLRARKVRVVRSGRGEAAQPRRVDLWLPGESGTVEVAVAPAMPLRPVASEPAPAMPLRPVASEPAPAMPLRPVASEPAPVAGESPSPSAPPRRVRRAELRPPGEQPPAVAVP